VKNAKKEGFLHRKGKEKCTIRVVGKIPSPQPFPERKSKQWYQALVPPTRKLRSKHAGTWEEKDSTL
jgi:hypothetical protein